MSRHLEKGEAVASQSEKLDNLVQEWVADVMKDKGDAQEIMNALGRALLFVTIAVYEDPKEVWEDFMGHLRRQDLEKNVEMVKELRQFIQIGNWEVVTQTDEGQEEIVDTALQKKLAERLVAVLEEEQAEYLAAGKTRVFARKMKTNG